MADEGLEATGGPAEALVEGGLEQELTAATAGVAEEQPSSPPDPAAAAPAPEGASGWTGVRDYAKAQGVDLPYDNDAAALNDLIQARRRLEERNYFAELGQGFAPHAEAIREFVQQRRQLQQQGPAPAPWSPPPFDEKWLAMVERDDATGVLRAKPGYDPAVAERVQAFADWRDKFLRNPAETLQPMVDERARQLVREEMDAHRQQQLAEQYTRQNESWIFQADAGGRRQFTPAGLVYARAAKDLWDGGMRDVSKVHAYAFEAARSAVLSAQLKAQAAPAATPALPAASVGGLQTRNGAGLEQPGTSQEGLSLQEMLRRNLAQAGAAEDLEF